MIKEFNRQPIIDLAQQGLSASQIVDRLGLTIGVRQVQRITAPYRAEKCLRARLDELTWMQAQLPGRGSVLVVQDVESTITERIAKITKQETSQ